MHEITMSAATGNIEALTAWVDERLEAADCGMKAQMQIDVAIDEIFSNIAFYAYAPGTGDVKVTLEIQADSGTAVLTFTDEGIAFDPMQRDDPDTSLSADERKIGGLGIFLVKKTMDSVTYRRENGQNILRITKKIF